MQKLFIFLLTIFIALNLNAEVLEKANKVVVLKSERKLQLFEDEKLLKTYSISLGFSPEGHKVQEGDGKTPEGNYLIDARYKSKRFHRALHISYPNEKDILNAKKLGVSPGGDIMIHGLKKGMSWTGFFHTLFDWTNGCIAVTNSEIEEIWEVVPNNTLIIIKP